MASRMKAIRTPDRQPRPDLPTDRTYAYRPLPQGSSQPGGRLPRIRLWGTRITSRGVTEVVIGSRKPRPLCEACGGPVWSKGERTVVLVDLPAFGRPVRLRWRKRRWTCPNPDCALRSFIEQDPTIGPNGRC